MEDFFYMNQESKELLEELQQEIVQKIFKKRIKAKKERIKEIEKKRDEQPKNCVCFAKTVGQVVVNIMMMFMNYQN